MQASVIAIVGGFALPVTEWSWPAMLLWAAAVTLVFFMTKWQVVEFCRRETAVEGHFPRARLDPVLYMLIASALVYFFALATIGFSLSQWLAV